MTILATSLWLTIGARTGTALVTVEFLSQRLNPFGTWGSGVQPVWQARVWGASRARLC